jgi:hypothetical protein
VPGRRLSQESAEGDVIEVNGDRDGAGACRAIVAAGGDPPMPVDRTQYITFVEGLLNLQP